MRLKNSDLIVALIISALNVLCLVLPFVPFWLRTILALPLIFALPGYMLTEALFYRRKIALAHRLLLTLGLSIVSVIVTGLLLDKVAAGLQRISWIVCLSLLTLAGTLMVALRRDRGGFRPALSINVRRPRIYEYCLFALALGGIIVALQYTSTGVAEQPHPAFTQFWMLPAENGYAVRVGIHSFEAGPVTYRVSVSAIPVSVSISIPVQFTAVLKAGEQVERTIDLSHAVQAGREKINVQARLYRLDRPGQVYRSVNLILRLPSSLTSMCCFYRF